jgi:small subunit ribosomal protein S9
MSNDEVTAQNETPEAETPAGDAPAAEAPAPKAPAPEAPATEASAPKAAAPEAAAAAPEAPAAEATEAPAAEAPPAPTPVAAGRKSAGASPTGVIHGLGRRKTAVARVFMKPGEGRWIVNGRTLEDYFPRSTLRQSVERPLAVTDSVGRYDIKVNVRGGGLHGQADAVRLGLARALLKVDEDYRPRLRAEELLTRDAREVERKKPGRPKARKRFQFSKR